MLHVAHMIDSLKIGGAQKLQVTFASALRQDRVRLTVITLQDSDTPFRHELEQMGVRILAYPAPTLLDPRRFWKLLRLIRRERFDLLHSHLTSANILAPLLGRMAGIPAIATLHGAKITMKSSNPLRARLENWVLRRAASRVVAVGESVAQVYQPRLSGRTIDIIPNAVADIPALSQPDRDCLHAELAGQPEGIVLITVGRLVLEKGYTYLLKALAKLRETHPHVRLIVVGDGVLKDDLAAQISALNLQDHAALLGSRSDVARLLAASDIYVSSSISEGLPVATLEAMSAGLPVIATRVGGHPAVIVEGTGLLIPTQDVDSLVKALTTLVNDAAKRTALGSAAREHVRRNFGTQAWMDKILSLYAELCPQLKDVR